MYKYKVVTPSLEMEIQTCSFQPNHFKTGKKGLSVTDGTDATLTGYCIYFLRSSYPLEPAL